MPFYKEELLDIFKQFDPSQVYKKVCNTLITKFEKQVTDKSIRGKVTQL